MLNHLPLQRPKLAKAEVRLEPVEEFVTHGRNFLAHTDSSAVPNTIGAASLHPNPGSSCAYASSPIR